MPIENKKYLKIKTLNKLFNPPNKVTKDIILRPSYFSDFLGGKEAWRWVTIFNTGTADADLLSLMRNSLNQSQQNVPWMSYQTPIPAQWENSILGSKLLDRRINVVIILSVLAFVFSREIKEKIVFHFLKSIFRHSAFVSTIVSTHVV